MDRFGELCFNILISPYRISPMLIINVLKTVLIAPKHNPQNRSIPLTNAISTEQRVWGYENEGLGHSQQCLQIKLKKYKELYPNSGKSVSRGTCHYEGNAYERVSEGGGYEGLNRQRLLEESCRGTAFHWNGEKSLGTCQAKSGDWCGALGNWGSWQ